MIFVTQMESLVLAISSDPIIHLTESELLSYHILESKSSTSIGSTSTSYN